MSLLLFSALWGCSGEEPGGGEDSSPSSCDPALASLDLPDFGASFSYLHETVDPADIDPASAGTPGYEHHLFLPTGGELRPELFVLLPGTNGHPGNNTLLLTLAARAGYQAIGLAYPTDYDVASLCAEAGDPEACSVGFYEEKLYGTDSSSELAIDEPDSVVGRLSRLLQAAADFYPEGGFERYQEGEQILWDQIVLAGFSQGSSLTAYLGKSELLARSVHMAGGCNPVVDAGGEIVPAQWCAEARATPSERMYALLHTGDEFEFYQEVWLEGYEVDAYGEITDAGSASPDYCTQTHLLSSSLEPAGGGSYHQSLAVDSFLPVDGEGVPVLAEDYYYLFGGGEP